MVVESFFNVLKAEARPSLLFFHGFVYATLALFLGWWVFRDNAGLVMVFLTVLAVIPLFHATLVVEEEKDESDTFGFSLLKEHKKAIMVLLWLFLGMTSAFALWYVFLPNGMAVSVFHIQSETIRTINQNLAAKVTANVVAKLPLVSVIFLNNLKVLIFSLLFSFIYGTGALFVIIWNSSVIGVAFGNLFRTKLAAITVASGIGGVGSYLSIVSLGLLRYFVHGIPEVIAYFIGGVAGGILSIAIAKRAFGTKSFEKIVVDVGQLVVIAIGVLVVAALLEVYVTPLLVNAF